ncbi:unnamed protein product [Rotaria sordida]|uniref:Uncharacterized protein n=1 Tax=Rotaria sordida TaxID=392033 RepID=A0A814M1C0_9BILA|nr:unnamed protein product [Rotaria sordida]CAF3863496.1 unnamed protein product [Rotaria sordida]
MANVCPLLIRPSFTGHTYHDFQLQFESPTTNCTVDPIQNLLLIHFSRISNLTSNNISYALYDLAKPNNESPHVQVFPNDRVNFCVRSAFNTGQNDITCHEFYMVTMLTSLDRTLWPLLIIFGYIIILIIAMFTSLVSQIFDKLSQTIFSGSITKKLLQTRDIFSFLPTSQRNLHDIGLTKFDEKKEFSKALDLIAKDCRTNTGAYIIQTSKFDEPICLDYF